MEHKIHNKQIFSSNSYHLMYMMLHHACPILLDHHCIPHKMQYTVADPGYFDQFFRQDLNDKF